ncbi:MAG: alpha-hydroxy-acid oxidizing protein [Pseudomonadales bacterium]|jgi:isopentenyl diphosphate isomerase/L-lactate dehydrogenase-like FMN-dependent dehydrogenase|nr:alpha-hydroxy-acid oxidizing protein [Pseudomonadales bacterium]
MTSHAANRRRFLQFLAASPLLRTAAPLSALLAANALEGAEILDDSNYYAEAAQWAVNVFDMERVARRNLSQAHWTYIAQGVDDDFTVQANSAAYRKIHLRPRRLVNVTEVSKGIELFGERMDSPLILAPVGGLAMAHPGGEVEAARGAKVTGHQMIHSNAASFKLDDVVAARGAPVWIQLYANFDWKVSLERIKLAQTLGAKAIFLTVDIPARNQERMRRFDRASPECTACHRPPAVSGPPRLDSPPSASAMLDWDYVKRLQDSTSMKVVIKGITHPLDAALCLEHGVDGILVSNHGGRADESGLGTIQLLPDIVNVVQKRIPVLVDGGIRRGTDILKAMALGASAVCIGRPYVWGVGAFGQEGVSRVLQILDAELDVALRQAGLTDIGKAAADMVKVDA